MKENSRILPKTITKNMALKKKRSIATLFLKRIFRLLKISITKNLMRFLASPSSLILQKKNSCIPMQEPNLRTPTQRRFSQPRKLITTFKLELYLIRWIWLLQLEIVLWKTKVHAVLVGRFQLVLPLNTLTGKNMVLQLICLNNNW